MMQDRKYEFVDGGIVNRASGEQIPADEPVFVLRARDVAAHPTLAQYLRLAPSNADAVLIRLADFERFALEHPERMKKADTDTSGGEWK